MAPEDESPVEATGGGGPAEGSELDACPGDAGSFVVELVTFVAEATGDDPMEMPPLNDAIDAEAVGRLLEADEDGSTKVRFRYAGCEVVVTGGGAMFVHA